jgi:integration host factor subunit beta
MLTLVAALLPIACAARQSSFRHEELVVLGRLQNQRDDGADGLWDSIFIARLHVARALRGHVRAKVLTIKYVAHSERSEDREFRFHLRRKDDGTYLACGDGGVGFVCP